ncbi:APC family permease [Candidatus Babeliales bacterium]|nr:APC family permease [Candidatus Babeliales bacterium]
MVKNKISITTAILININVIIGSAFYIGAQGILKKSGILAPVTWIIWGIILLPIVLVLAQLSNIYPRAGGLYIYCKEALGNFWGIISGWGYFIGCIAGNAIIIHFFGLGIRRLGFEPVLKTLYLSNLQFDIILILFFSLLNLTNINFLEKAIITFAILKSIPLFFVVISSFFLFDAKNIITAPLNISGFFESIPLVVFAYMGFEVCCSIAHQIKNGKKGTGKAILISFGLIMAIYTILQFCLLSIHGVTSSKPFLEILPRLFSNPYLSIIGNRIIELCILSSFLGGFYGMFYTNNWILYAIAQEKNIPFSKKLTLLNKYNIPWVCVAIQSFITILFLFITQNAHYLITMSVFAVIITYLLCAIAFLVIYIRKKNLKKIILATISTLSCIYIFYICIVELIESGIKYILPFLIILGIGILLNKISLKHPTK